MSHAATNWAIRQRGLLPATKLVLWHLADRHNPDHGCFPSQERLAHDAEVSISQLNVHLKRLEEAGLIRREQRIDPQTKRRQSTRYILGCEPEFAQGTVDTAGANKEHLPERPTPENGDGANSGFEAVPSPVLGQSQLRFPETNLVREPLREPAGACPLKGAPAPAGKAPPETSEAIDAVARFWAAAVNEGRFIPQSAVSPVLASRMVALGLVTPEQLRTRGIAA